MKSGKVTRYKLENHVPIVAVSEEPRVSDDPSAATGDRLHFNPMSQAWKNQARDGALIAFPRCRGIGRPVAQDSRIASNKASKAKPGQTQCRGGTTCR